MIRFLCAVLVAALAACATTGAAFTDKLAIGYSAASGARSTADNLLIAGKITAADAQNVQNQVDMARTGLDVARSTFLAACPTAASTCTAPAATDKLALTMTLLTALQAYLVQQGATK